MRLAAGTVKRSAVAGSVAWAVACCVKRRHFQPQRPGHPSAIYNLPAKTSFLESDRQGIIGLTG